MVQGTNRDKKTAPKGRCFFQWITPPGMTGGGERKKSGALKARGGEKSGKSKPRKQKAAASEVSGQGEARV